MTRQQRLEQLFETMDAIMRWKAQRERCQPMPEGLPTHTRLRILEAIARGHGETIKQLAERFCMTSSAATQLVNSLVLDGFVTREESADDRRKTILNMTAEGKKTLLISKKLTLSMITDMYSALNERELQQIHQLQEKMVTRL